jgi:hypothetical protein
MSRDADWAPLARASRAALARLGYVTEPRCLPGEPGAGQCGYTFAEHAAAYLAALKAAADHHLAHLDAPAGLLEYVYAETAAELECGRTCRWPPS